MCLRVVLVCIMVLQEKFQGEWKSIGKSVKKEKRDVVRFQTQPWGRPLLLAGQLGEEHWRSREKGKGKWGRMNWGTKKQAVTGHGWLLIFSSSAQQAANCNRLYATHLSSERTCCNLASSSYFGWWRISLDLQEAGSHGSCTFGFFADSSDMMGSTRKPPENKQTKKSHKHKPVARSKQWEEWMLH